ncbi:phage terminase large subunit [Brevundimonas pishanensis]|uniref:phage terminase large subunit n=1 Tax=Brevundimonas pishanensis TaxID=2896315 RepID=UPI001FA818F1|nr:phage terminase large subunit [Brevundimonas pishanensis]
MSALPLPADIMVHSLARHEFEVFLELVFRHLNPDTTLSRGWYLSAMCQALAEVAQGRERRLQITVPPRHLKSIMTTVAFPAWLLGQRPETRIICASYGQELSAALSRSFRKVIQSRWYSEVFPQTAASIIRDTEADLGTRQGGYRFATAVGGTVTGIGADLIIIDDLMKAQDASYPEARAKAQRFVDETLLSRLDNKQTGAVIAIQQRLHEDDVSAHLSSKGGYRHLDLPAIAMRDEIIPLSHGRTHIRRIGDVLNPQREPREVLDQLKAEMGPRAFEAQYQQNPTPLEGDYLQWDKVQFYDEAPPRNRLNKVVHSWDVASSSDPKADYSVGTIWGHDGTSWLLLDVIRQRLLYPDLLARLRLERKLWKADAILVEKSSVGPALLEDLARDMRGISDPQFHARACIRLGINATLPKAERYFASVERLYSGFAKLPRSATWLDDLHREMQTFPAARYDDQVDSLSQFLNWAPSRQGRNILKDSDTRRDGPRPR